MLHREKTASVSETVILMLVFLNAIVLKFSFIRSEKLYTALMVTVPLLLLIIYYECRKRL